MFLFFTSLLTSGYAFYNRYNNTNKNTWIYLINGLIGVGICIFSYVFVNEKLGYADALFNTQFAENLYSFISPGFYITGIFSVFLFFTGFGKSENEKQNINTVAPQHISNIVVVNQTLPDKELIPKNIPVQNDASTKIDNSKPSLKTWLKDNPHFSINDYYQKFGNSNK